MFCLHFTEKHFPFVGRVISIAQVRIHLSLFENRLKSNLPSEKIDDLICTFCHLYV